MSAGPPRAVRRWAGVAAAALAFLLAAPGLAAAATSSLADYRDRVGRAHASVAAATDAKPDRKAVVKVATEVRALLPAGERVSEGTRTVVVADPTLERLLDGLETAGTSQDRAVALDALERHLVTLKVAAGAHGDPAAGDPAALARLLREVRPGTDTAARSWAQELTDRILQAVTAWLARLSGTREGATRVRAVWIAVLLVLAAVALLVTWRLARSWRRSLARRDARAAGSRDADAPVVAAAEGLPDDPAAFADTLARSGRHRDAVRALFGGAARTLGERGVLERTRTRTNAELVAEVTEAAPAVAPALRALSDEFEVAWYGHRDPGDEGYRAARGHFEDVTAPPRGQGGEAS